VKTKPQTKLVLKSSKLKVTAVDPITHRNVYLKNHPKLGGRKKGTPNRFTTLKQSFLDAYMLLGGTEGLTLWAKKNHVSKGEFYKLITKMLPREVHVSPDSELSPGNLTALKDEELDAIVNGK